MSIDLASPVLEGETSVIKPAFTTVERNGLPSPRTMSFTPFFFRMARPQRIVPKEKGTPGTGMNPWLARQE